MSTNNKLFVFNKLVAIFMFIGLIFSCSSDEDAPTSIENLDLDIDIEMSENFDIKMSASSVSTDGAVLTLEGDHNYDYFVLSQNGIAKPDNIAGFNAAGDALTNIIYTVAALTPNTEYTFSLQGCVETTCSAEVGRTNLITKPNSPENFNFDVVKNTSTSLSLVWSAPSPGGAHHYMLYRLGASQIRVTGTEYEVSGLGPFKEYTFDLIACNKNNICSPTNNNVRLITTPPDKVKNINISKVGSTTLTLSWEISEGTTFYVLKSGDREIKVPDGNVNRVVIDDLASKTTHKFSLQSCNDTGCSDAVTVGATTGVIVATKPVTPSGLDYTGISSTKVELDWDGTEGATFYRVFYTNITSGGSEVSNQVETSEFATTAALTAGTEYRFEVEACNDSGCSSRDDITLATAPSVPSNLVADKVTAGSVTLRWYVVAGANQYVVYNGNNPIATNTGLGNIVVAGLTYNTTYTFTIRACNSQSCSDLSDSVEVITLNPPQDFFTISYSNMASEASATRTPKIVSGKDCDLEGFTIAGVAIYTVSPNTSGNNSPTLLNIDDKTGVINNTGSSPGAYRVTVKVDGVPTCNTNLLIYNTITPANREELVNHLFGNANSDVAFHGDMGDYNYIDTSQVTSFYNLFRNKSSFNGDVSEWDTSQVTDMASMFASAAAFNQSLEKWDTSKVQNMSWIFNRAVKFNQPLSNWNTSQVRNMGSAFRGAEVFNHSLSNWNTSQVTNMDFMFSEAKAFNKPIGGWDTSKVQNMSSMFREAVVFNGTLSNWDTSQVTTMSSMFRGAIRFNKPIGGWNTSKVWTMSYMFQDASDFDQPLNGWKTSQVQSMTSMFERALDFNQPLDNWNTFEVRFMRNMFRGASKFNQDLSEWQVNNVSTRENIFEGSAMEKLTGKHPVWVQQ